MDRTFALLAVAASFAMHAHAGEIYKCVGDGVTAYQSMPCGRSQSESRLPVVGSSEPRKIAYATPAPSQAPVQRALRPGPWKNQTLVLGMSDDEVLNMPAWGRPSRIVRTRLSKGWQEVWTYGSPVLGERELRFVNARLTDIGDGAPAAVAANPFARAN